MFLQLTKASGKYEFVTYVNMDKVLLIEPAKGKETNEVIGSYLFFFVDNHDEFMIFVKETPNEILSWYNMSEFQNLGYNNK